MKNIFIYLFIFSLCISGSFAQEEDFYLKLSSDTVLAGNVLQLTFVANNVSGQFEAPDLKGLNVISGPNSSSSMSMVNGSVTQYATYSYGVYFEDIGEVIIPPSFFVTEDGTLETEPTSIIILPNPEGIIEQPPSQSGLFQFNFPNNPKVKKKENNKMKSGKKKRKLKKI